MSGWEFRTVFWLTAVMRSCAAVVDIVIVKRWNAAIGIPDTWMYMLGYNIVYQACVSYMVMAYCQALTAHSKIRCNVSHEFGYADRGDTRVHACGYSDEPAVPQRDGGDSVRPFGRYEVARMVFGHAAHGAVLTEMGKV
jgi:hypothetical protein